MVPIPPPPPGLRALLSEKLMSLTDFTLLFSPPDQNVYPYLASGER